MSSRRPRGQALVQISLASPKPIPLHKTSTNQLNATPKKLKQHVKRKLTYGDEDFERARDASLQMAGISTLKRPASPTPVSPTSGPPTPKKQAVPKPPLARQHSSSDEDKENVYPPVAQPKRQIAPPARPPTPPPATPVEPVLLDPMRTTTKKPTNSSSQTTLGSFWKLGCTTKATSSKYFPSTSEGFQNKGNTCYVNAVLSALTSLQAFTTDLLDTSETLEGDGTPDELRTFNAMVSIVKAVQDNQRSNANTLELKKAISAECAIFQGTRQQDAHEFLLACLTGINDEVLRTTWATAVTQTVGEGGLTPYNTPSPVERNFEGEFLHVLTCAGCQRATEHTEKFVVVSLNLPDLQLEKDHKTPLSIQQLVANIFSNTEEEITKDCSDCGCTTCFAKTTLISLPRFLVVHLKRFEPVAIGSTISLKKRSDAVELSKTVDVARFCEENVKAPPKAADSWKRQCRLVAGIMHHGKSATAGHYTCYTKTNPGSVWDHWDDSKKSQVNWEKVSQQGEKDSYVLFYAF